jgi:hypothetical protein
LTNTKFDAVVEAVRYQPDGNVDWVRAYLRRGPTFSDVILLDRQTVIEHIKAGKVFMSGKRIPRMASTFETSAPFRLVQKDGKDILTTSEGQPDHDQLADVPVI